MTRDDALKLARQSACFCRGCQEAAEKVILALEQGGLKFDEPEAMIECGCNAAARCPQGRTGMAARCRIPRKGSVDVPAQATTRPGVTGSGAG